MKRIIKAMAIIASLFGLMSCNLELDGTKLEVSENRILELKDLYFSDFNTRTIYTFGMTTWYTDGSIKIDIYRDTIDEFIEVTGMDISEDTFADITIIHELCHARLKCDDENINHGSKWKWLFVEKARMYIQDNGLSEDLIPEFLKYTL